jgi:putative ABC transport system substrate-binding protein
MRRREFITLLGGAAAAWPLAARGQPGERVRRVGVLMGTSESDPESREHLAAFQQRLNELGWIVARNLQLDSRWVSGDAERAQSAAAELVRLIPDVILANGSTALRALQQATRTVPIVFVVVSEPLAQGFVSSLARPDGNTTGFTNLEPTLGAKWLELLKEIAPSVTRVAMMFNPRSAVPNPLFFRSAEAAGPNFAVKVIMAAVHDAAEIEGAITTLGREPGGGLIFPPDYFTVVHRKLIVGLAARYRLPAIYAFRSFSPDGGLLYYGVDRADQFRQAAGYVDRIVRGEKPGDLPVQQPTKFELVINLKTATVLGLTVPPTLLARADEVIE